jgi:UDP-2,4-diacetamido-2,4,6-trideoxy-beta-L-altropyranose hydrolase
LNNIQQKKKILFRADGNNEIGLGHLYRCLAIAERVNRKFDCFFATRQPTPAIKNIISASSTLLELVQFESYLNDAQEIAEKIVPRNKIDIIVLDGYFFNTSYQKVLKEKCNSVVVSIDDDQPFHYVSDVVINHAGGIQADQISKEPYTKLFLGNDYLMLRKEFLQTFNKEKHVSGVTSVLICFGGADPGDCSRKILDCIKGENGIRKIVVVLGAAYAQTEKLVSSISDYSHVQILNNLDAERMSEVMNGIDLAIVPSSTIGLEAFACRMLLITGMTADNQKNIYKGLLKEPTVVGIGDFAQLRCNELRMSINALSQKFQDYTFQESVNKFDSLVKIFESISL